MGVGRTKVGEVGNQRDVLLVPSQRGKPLGEPNLSKCSGFRRIETVLGKAKATTKKEQPGWRGRVRGGWGRK